MTKATLTLTAGAVVALLTLSACVDDPNYYRHRDRMAYDDGYEVYYDNHYGRSVYDGYWNDDDGYYYYRTERDRPYARDEARHFRRDRGGDAYMPVRMHDWRNRH